MSNNNFIEDYINSKDKLTNLNSLEIKELILELKNYKIKYLEKLNSVPKYFKFGVEIEFSNSNLESIYNKLTEEGLDCYFINNYGAHVDNLNNKKWEVKIDTTTTEHVPPRQYVNLFGGEVASRILTNNKTSFEELNTVCEVIKNNFGTAGDDCGLHFHVDAKVFKDNTDNYLNFLKYFRLYEQIFYRVGFGEYNYPRSQIDKYSHTIGNDIKYIIDYSKFTKSLSLFKDVLPHNHNAALDFINLYNKYNKRTVEARYSNGSVDPAIIQTGLNLFLSSVKYSISSKFDVEKCEHIFSQEGFNNCTYAIDYNYVDINKSFDMFDDLFKTNEEKINTLKQYIKNDTRNSLESDKKIILFKRKEFNMTK